MWSVNKDNAFAVIVASSAAVSCSLGALTAHILTKRYMEAKYESLIETEVQRAKAYFSIRNKTDEYADPVALAEKVLKDKYREKAAPYSPEVVVVEDDEDDRAVDESEPEDMETVEQRIIDRAKAEVESVKRDLGVFDEDDDDDDDELITMNVFTQQEIAMRDGDSPYVISLEEFMDGEKEYTRTSLTYFEEDEVLVDDQDKPIHHIHKIVGESNLTFGRASGDPNVVFIRNDELEVDFEVSRSDGSFTEEVLGYVEHSDKPRPRKFREYD